jgi:hypothetical protein
LAIALEVKITGVFLVVSWGVISGVIVAMSLLLPVLHYNRRTLMRLRFKSW